jgi:hypothetical protein
MGDHSDIDHTGLTGVGETGTAAHIADNADAHDASAISVLDSGANFTGTDVEAVLAELQDNIDGVSGGGVTAGHVKYTGGDLALNNTSWTTVGITDITLACATGDVVEACVSARFTNAATTCGLDVATIVSAAPVNYFASAGGASAFGIQGLVGNASVNTSAGACVMYTIQAGDISGGNVVFRLMFRSTGSKTVLGTTDLPLQFSVKNLGQ